MIAPQLLSAIRAEEAGTAPLRDYTYVDAADLTIVNKVQPDDACPLARVDVDRYPGLSPRLRMYYGFSTGLAVVFETDSRNIGAKWSTCDLINKVNFPALAQKGLDLYIRDGSGRWIHAGVGEPAYTGQEHEANIVGSMDTTMKLCMLYLPLFDTVDSLEIGVDHGATIRAAANPFDKRVVFVGSSITHGIGVSRPGMPYPARFGRMAGVEVPNLGASGLCRLEQCFARIVADTEADAFVFDTFSNPSAEQIRERLMPFVETIRKAHPLTPLIFLQTELRESGNFDLAKREYEALKRNAASEEMKRVTDRFSYVYFLDPGLPLGSDHEATVDGVHPTDLGMSRILDGITLPITDILVRHGILK